MQANYAPELIYDPTAEAMLFGSGSVLEDHLIAVDSDTLISAIREQHIPGIRIHEVHFAPEYADVKPIGVGYGLTVGLDLALRTPIESLPPDAESVEDSLNLQVLAGLHSIREREREIRGAKPSDEYVSQAVKAGIAGQMSFMSGVVSGVAEVGPTERYALSLSLGLYALRAMRGKTFCSNEGSRSIPFKSELQIGYEFENKDLPRILQIIKRN